ncbi:LCP family protein [Microcella frigidaquae]|uniref:LCP family protein required for cell wall assembly n=1 Tax=Microcella frigidaquae TaxID=424758 RepID=A0A840XNV3_9MICO|nr:LCP family protein required for cell wall assembly [Microcella frigidaquae]NHN44594.1 LCP family protein [Microcella frigidaquae]
MSHTAPLRHPNTRDPQVMRRRAWWLLGLNLLIPGSAQLLAGDRRWGRFAVGSTFVLWAVAALALLLVVLWRPAALTIASTALVLWVAQLALVFYAVLWFAATIDTMRLVRLVRTPPRARLPIAAFAVLSLLLTTGTAGYAAVLTGAGRDALGSVFADGGYVEPIDGRYTILLLGGDAGDDRIGLRPDSMTLLSVDAQSGAVTMIGIPRNLYSAPFSEGSPLWEVWPNGFDCGDDCLLAYLYPWVEEHPELYPDAAAAGSTPPLEAMKDAIEGVTGLPVQYTVLIDMAGFTSLIDALGGVVVTVDEPVSRGINGGTVYGVIPAGEQRMDGETALWYARSRYNLTDFDRMQHQRDLQEAMLRQLDPATVLTRFQAIAQASSELVRTDVPQGMVGVLSDLAVQSRQHEIRRLELVPPVIDNVVPDWQLIRALVAEAVAPLPTPTETPEP